MDQSSSWETNHFLASQEIPCILWNPNVHYRPHKSLSSASTIQSIPPHPSSWRSILIFPHLRLSLPSGLFPSGFPTKTMYTPLFSPIRATCPAHLILGFITRTILGEECRSLSSSLCSFLHSLVTSCLLGPNIFLNTLFSNTPSLRSFLNVSDQVSHPHKSSQAACWPHRKPLVSHPIWQQQATYQAADERCEFTVLLVSGQVSADLHCIIN